MKNVTIQCDRCGKMVEGCIDEQFGHKTTGGFYDVTEGIWKKFAIWEEENVCDKCMHSDLRYIKWRSI